MLLWILFYFNFFEIFISVSHRKWESRISSQCCSLLGPQTPRKEQRDVGNSGETFSKVSAVTCFPALSEFLSLPFLDYKGL